MCNCGKNKQQNPQPVNRAAQPVTFSQPSIISDPTIWGPTLWRILHTLAEFSDRGRSIHVWTALIRMLFTSIPCAECRLHFTQYIRANPMRLNQTTLQPYIVTYFFNLHNNVNQILNQPIATTSVLPTGDRTQLLSALSTDIHALSSSFNARTLDVIRKLVQVLS